MTLAKAHTFEKLFTFKHSQDFLVDSIARNNVSFFLPDLRGSDWSEANTDRGESGRQRLLHHVGIFSYH